MLYLYGDTEAFAACVAIPDYCVLTIEEEKNNEMASK